MKNLIVFCIVCLATQLSFSQGLTAKVVDARSGDPIAFATVITGEHSGLITNEDGVFVINEKQLARINDSISVSFMGYEKVGLWKPSGEMTIKLLPKSFELAQVFINANPLEADEVVEKVKENLETNYTVGLSKKRIFFRQSDHTDMSTVDFRFKKSTIAEINEELIKQIEASVQRKDASYDEVVGDFYGDYRSHKFHIAKAAQLSDSTKNVSIDGLSERLERIFKENVKPDSYLKIRSGWIGTKVQLDELSEENPEEAEIVEAQVKKEEPSHFQPNIKNRISEVYEQLFFNENSELDFLEKSNRYRFTHQDYTFIDDAAVYVINFEPKGKKDFKGTIYVNTEDFAIMRLDFENVRPLRKFGLLGISYRRSVFRGKMLFAKEASGGYGPRYLELEDGEYVGVDRPLNVIEKNKHVKGRRKQNELALHLNIGVDNISKYELVVFSSEDISQGAFQNATENSTITATQLSKYDPNFWKEHTIMEPNAAIRAFEVFQ